MSLEPAAIFRALSGETRIRIIEMLKIRGPLGSSEIAEALDMTPAAVSQHLKILKLSGILGSKRNGYWIPYHINESALDRCRIFVEAVCACRPGHRLDTEHADIPGGGSDDLDGLSRKRERLEWELRILEERIDRLRRASND